MLDALFDAALFPKNRIPAHIADALIVAVGAAQRALVHKAQLFDQPLASLVKGEMATIKIMTGKERTILTKKLITL